MSAVLPIFSMVYPVYSYAIDTSGRLTIPYLCRFLQETAYHHAEHLGVGHRALHPRGWTWVLLGLAVRIRRLPLWEEQITVWTWPSGKERLLYLRDFKVQRGDETVAEATTQWIPVEIAKRRPCREPLDLPRGDNAMGRVWPEAFSLIPDMAKGDGGLEIRVGYHDLDLNGHVNNIRYVEWMLDGFPPDFYRSHLPKALVVRYEAETLLGDRILSQRIALDDGRFGHMLFRVRDGKPVVRAMTAWEEEAS